MTSDVPTDETLFVPRSPGDGEGSDPGFSIGPYRIERELGRGGMGVVYLARDPDLKRRIALKILPRHFAADEQARARFRREAEAASRLSHPNLCGVIAVGEHDGVPWLAMRYVEGRPLSQLLRERREQADGSMATLISGVARSTRREPWAAAAALAEKLGRALHVAHEAGIVHRDLKPGNVMIDPAGEPVILDFGLARDESHEGAGLTQSGDVLGTPSYMAPEQIRGEAHRADRTLDVWALGVILYELLTGGRPFRGPTRDAIYRSILEDEPPGLRRTDRSIPADLEIVLATALEKEPARRYGTALDLAEDLRRVLDIEPIHARKPGVAGRLLKYARRHPARAALIGLLAVGMPAVAGLVTRQHLTSRRLEESVARAVGAARAALAERSPRRAREQVAVIAGLAAEHPEVSRLRRACRRLEAIERAETLVLDHESDPDGRLAKAEIEALEADHPGDPRLAVLRAAVEIQRTGEADTPPDATAADREFLEALRLSAAGRHGEALKRLQAHLREHPRAHGIAWAAAEEATRTQQFEAALALAESSRMVAGGFLPRRRARYSVHLRRAGHLDAAVLEAKEALARAPDDAVVKLHFANALAERGDRGEARRAFEALIRSAPDFPEAWRGHGALLFDLGDYEGAAAAWRRAIALHPAGADAHHNLGDALIQLGRPEEAEVELRRAIELRPDFPFAHNSLGVALRDQGRLDDAIREIDRAIELRRHYPEALANLGSVHHRRGDAESAERYYREALALNIGHPGAAYNLALLLHRDRPEEAVELYRRVIEQRPDDAEAHNNLADVLGTLGRHEEALAHARRASELAPEDAATWNTLAAVYNEMGRRAEAAAAFEKAALADPELIQPRANLMLVLEEEQPLLALAHGLELVRLDETFAKRAGLNLIRLKRAVLADESLHHPLRDALRAADLLSRENDDEADRLVVATTPLAIALPDGRPGSHDRALKRSALLELIPTAKELEMDDELTALRTAATHL